MTLQFAHCNLHFAMLYSRRNATAPNKVFTLRFACPSGNRLRRLREYKTIPKPHGGCGLVDRFLPDYEKDYIIKNSKDFKIYSISDADVSIFYRIADGVLSPLEGPMNSEEFNRVLDEEVIVRNGQRYAWTIPISFPTSTEEIENFQEGDTVLVRTEKGEIIGLLKIEDIFYFDKRKYNCIVYQTERTDHPGARIFNDDPRDYLIGGKIWAFRRPRSNKYEKYLMSPCQTRNLFKKRGWDRIVAFQTRNALHRAHEYTIVYALEQLTRQGYFAGAALNPLIGATKSDDVPAEVRMETYITLIENKLLGLGDKDDELWKKVGYDLTDQVILIAMDMKMFYAGPKEAIMHAIYRQNYGFTDIIIGRKHADAPFDDGTPIWGDFEAQEKFEKLQGKLEIKPFRVGYAAYFEELGKVRLVDEYKDKGYKIISISGKELRKRLQDGKTIDERIMRKEVADILMDYYQKNNNKDEKIVIWHDTKIMKEDREKRNGHRAVVIWLTGLSGSGKSTIATELQRKLFDAGCNVYILDGDNIRHGLNSDLGFSPEDREENIRRIGEVAKLFADAGFIVITSFISPYKKDRQRARNLLKEGEFIEVYVKAPLEICEKRDVKGLYKKARLGEIKEFTGISAPYEEPDNPEIVIETDRLDVNESVKKIIDYLKANMIINPDQF